MEKTINSVVAAIEREARAQGFTLTSLAKKAGLADTTLTKKKFDRGNPSMTTLAKVAAVLGCKPTDFMVDDEPPAQKLLGEVRAARVSRRAPPSRKNLPVRGTASGALANGFEISPHIIEYVDRPPGLEGVDDAYAIYVVGESMCPEHKPGELRFVHPHRRYRADDTIILQTRAYPTAGIEAYIKNFVRETPDEVTVRQLNPAAVIKYKKSTIFAIHRVLTVNELFGV
jgi:transcriptional regulator with XRE-family HTH domain